MFLHVISHLHSAVKQNVFLLQSMHKHKPDTQGTEFVCVQKRLISMYNSVFGQTYLKLPLAAALGKAGLFLQLWQWTRAHQMPVARLGLPRIGRPTMTLEQHFAMHGSPSCSHGHKLMPLFTCTFSKLILPKLWAAVAQGCAVCASVDVFSYPWGYSSGRHGREVILPNTEALGFRTCLLMKPSCSADSPGIW